MRNATFIYTTRLISLQLKKKAFQSEGFVGKTENFLPGEVMQDVTSDEIDLFDMIEIIWDGKWLISAITGIFVIARTAGAPILPPSLKVVLILQRLIKHKWRLLFLNDTPGISQPIYARDKLIGQEGVILSEDLFDAFIAELRLGQFCPLMQN